MRHDFMECEQNKRYRDVFNASGERLAAGTRIERVRASKKGTDTSGYPRDIGDDDRPENNDSEDTAAKHGLQIVRRRVKETAGRDRASSVPCHAAISPYHHPQRLHAEVGHGAWHEESAIMFFNGNLTSTSTADIAMLIPQDLRSDAATASS